MVRCILHGRGMKSPTEGLFFVAFKLLAIDGEDIRPLPLVTRKTALQRIMPRIESRLRYLDHIEGRGVVLFRWRATGTSKGSLGSGRMVAT